jgi:hypothetical protein
MRRSAGFLLLSAALLGSLPAFAQGVVEPGEWKRKTTTEVPGMYTGPLESEGLDCYTSGDRKIYADLKLWAAEMAAAQGGGCKAESPKAEGTALSVTLVCDEGKRYELRHDFHGAKATMDTQAWDGQEKGAKSHVELERVAEKCSPETIEQWKAWNPGKKYEP